MKPRTFLETVSALYSVAWVWLHMYLIYVYGVVRIGEPNPVIITCELFASTVFLILWIVRAAKEALQNKRLLNQTNDCNTQQTYQTPNAKRA